MSRSDFCEKCGCHFFAHNDDGSCVSDEEGYDEDDENWKATHPLIKDKDLLTDALITSCPYCGSYELATGGEWSAKNEDGEYQEALTEFICENCARSHWL